MLASKTARLLTACGGQAPRWVKRHQSRATVNPALDNDRLILKPDRYVHVPEEPLCHVLWKDLDKWADKIALECCETGRKYNYATVYKHSINLAKALRGRLKIQPRNSVAILLPNVPEFPIALLGTIEAGLIATTINPIYTKEEISRQIIDSDTKAIITLCEYHERVQVACREAKRSIPILTIKTKQGEATPPGAIDFAEFCEKETKFDLQPCHPDDVIVMPYSSGTTGLPKGVELTHKNLIANLCQTVSMEMIFTETTKNSQDVVPAVLPMFHIYGMTVNSLKLLQKGNKVITVPKFTPNIYINVLDRYKPNHLFLVPPIILFLGGSDAVTKKHLESVRSVVSGAAPLGATDLERFVQKSSPDVVALQGYGMTETSPVICFTPVEKWRECLGSIGHVLPNTEIKIVALDDPTFTSLGPNEQGEMLVKGPQVMLRYHNNPTATQEVFQDGWLRTGDMGYYDDQKIVWITDRLKELIKVKGFQVAPAELEELIRNHHQVADAAVIGVPHPIYGEVPKAFIVAKPNMEVDCENIKDYVSKKVASYKKLEGGVQIMEAIPKNSSGKIMRRTLKTQYGESL